jgi:hypothetical protein
MRLMNEQECSQEQPLVSFFASLKAVFRVQMTPIRLQPGVFGNLKIGFFSAIM